MRLIEIQEGICIKADEIEAVEKRDEGGSIVYTHHRKFLSFYPYETLVSMLKQEEAKEPVREQFVSL